MTTAQITHQMMHKAMVTLWVAVAGMAVLATTILSLDTHAVMLSGAIGNDGFGGFDGSILSKSEHDQDAGRVSEFAIDGGGLAANGLHDRHDAAGKVWLGGKSGGSHDGFPFWFIVDLGASYTLDRMHVWNWNDGGSPTTPNREVLTADIYVFDGAAEPNASNTDQNDVNMVTTGWTLFSGAQAFTTQASSASPLPASDIIDFKVAGVGTPARFVAINILSSVGGGLDSFVGLNELQFFAVPLPEPSTLAMLVLGGLALSRGVRRHRKVVRFSKDP